jgi:hypothetical protein
LEIQPLSQALLQSRLLDLFGACALEQSVMERAFVALPQHGEGFGELTSRLAILCRRQLDAMSRLSGDAPMGWDAARRLLAPHPLRRSYLLQSGIVQRALDFGGRGASRNLASLICGRRPSRQSPYAAALDEFFLTSPLAIAVEQGAASLRSLIGLLPPGARILSLANGEGVEPATRKVTLDAVDLTISPEEPVHLPASLRRESYDLIFALGLMNHMPDLPHAPECGALGLTTRLFSLLKRGGQLILGNCLNPGDPSPLSNADRFAMETLLELNPFYRTTDDMLGFADAVPDALYSAVVMDETLARPARASSLIGHLMMRKL